MTPESAASDRGTVARSCWKGVSDSVRTELYRNRQPGWEVANIEEERENEARREDVLNGAWAIKVLLKWWAVQFVQRGLYYICRSYVRVVKGSQPEGDERGRKRWSQMRGADTRSEGWRMEYRTEYKANRTGFWFCSEIWRYIRDCCDDDTARNIIPAGGQGNQRGWWGSRRWWWATKQATSTKRPTMRRREEQQADGLLSRNSAENTSSSMWMMHDITKESKNGSGRKSRRWRRVLHLMMKYKWKRVRRKRVEKMHVDLRNGSELNSLTWFGPLFSVFKSCIG